MPMHMPMARRAAADLLMPLVVGWCTIGCVMIGAQIAEMHHIAVNTAAAHAQQIERVRSDQAAADAYARGYHDGSRRMACPRRHPTPEI